MLLPDLYRAKLHGPEATREADLLSRTTFASQVASPNITTFEAFAV